jgi:hypothetical protein
MAADYPSLPKSEPLVPVLACTPLFSARPAVLIGAVAALAFGVTAGAMGAFALVRPASPPVQVGAAAPDAKPCAEQTWPYIDHTCLKDRGGPEVRAVRVLPVDAPPQSRVHTAAAPAKPAPETAAAPAAAVDNADAKPDTKSAAEPVKKPRKTAKRKRSRQHDAPRSAYAYDRGYERRYRYERDSYGRRGRDYGPGYGYAPQSFGRPQWGF